MPRIVIGSVLLLVAFVPFQSLEAPLWTVLVTDQSNKPVGGILIRENYQNYSAESEGHELDLSTDRYGRVTFPAQTIRVSGAKRFVMTLSSALGGVHASFGANAYVNAFGDGVEGISVKNGYVES